MLIKTDWRRVMSMTSDNIKTTAHQIVDRLPDNATWDDLMYEIYVRQGVDAGLKDSREGRTVSVKEVRALFNLPE